MLTIAFALCVWLSGRLVSCGVSVELPATSRTAPALQRTRRTLAGRSDTRLDEGRLLLAAGDQQPVVGEDPSDDETGPDRTQAVKLVRKGRTGVAQVGCRSTQEAQDGNISDSRAVKTASLHGDRAGKRLAQAASDVALLVSPAEAFRDEQQPAGDRRIDGGRILITERNRSIPFAGVHKFHDSACNAWDAPDHSLLGDAPQEHHQQTQRRYAVEDREGVGHRGVLAERAVPVEILPG